MSGLRIAEFPCDGRSWHVDWIGRLALSPLRRPCVEVVLSPFKMEAPKGRAIRAPAHFVDCSQRETVLVPVPTLPALAIGSVWRNGSRLPVEIYASSGQCTVNVGEGGAGWRAVDVRFLVEDGWIIPPGFIPVDPGLHGGLIAFATPTDPLGILVPAWELVRVFLGSSSRALSAIVNSSSPADAMALLIDPAATGRSSDGLEVWVEPRRGVDLAEAVVGALLSESAPFRLAAARLHALIVVKRDELRAGKRLLPMILPPFLGTAQLSGRSISWQLRGGGRRLLILEINEADWPTGLRRIIVVRPARRTVSATPNFVKAPGLAAQRANPEVVWVRGDRPTKRGERTAPVDIDGPTLTFDASIDTRVSNEPPEEVETLLLPGDAEPSEGFSLEDGDRGRGPNAGKLRLRHYGPPRRAAQESGRQPGVPASVVLFRHTLAWLCESGVAAEPIVVGAEDWEVPDLSLVPGVVDGKLCEFAFVDAAMQLRRRAMVAQLELAAQFFYLFDFEGWDNGYGAERDRHHMLLVAATSLEALAPSRLLGILEIAALGGGTWFKGRELPGLRYRLLRHTRTTAAGYGAAILGFMVREGRRQSRPAGRVYRRDDRLSATTRWGST